jgi:hypothetical protein
MTPAAIKRKYQKRILGILARIADTLRDAGVEVEGPWDLSSDDYWWSILADVDGSKVDVSFRIFESEHYDGERGGVNFGVDVVEEGGRVLGGLTPFNYSLACWVDRKDAVAVERRFRIIEEADPSDIIPLLERVGA